LQHDWLVVVLSLAAALAFAGSSSLKHVSAGDAPDAQSLHPGKVGRFIRATVSHRLFLGGMGCDGAGLVLHRGALTVVQPLLLTSLVFALVGRQSFGHQRITRGQIGWALILSGSLGGFLLLATSGASRVQTADRVPAIAVGIVGTVLALTGVELGRRQRSGGGSAALIGVAVGVIYAANAALLKAITDIAARAPWHLLLSWQPYVLVVLGGAGLLLNQLAFQAGPITASLPATATIDPLLSILIGVVVYDEPFRRGPAGGLALVVLLVSLGVAVIQLARSADA
jgi:hypothetical protein